MMKKRDDKRLKQSQSLTRAVVMPLVLFCSMSTQANSIWTPTSGTTWQYQLEGEINTSINAEVFDIDLTSPVAVIEELQRQGKKVVCYFSVATNELYRKDSDLFPPEIQGEIYDKWSDEAWLDIKQIDKKKPLC